MYFKIFKILTILNIIFFANNVFSADLYFDSNKNVFKVEEIFKIDVMIDPEGDSINAIEGEIYFPEDILILKNIYDGESILNFWVEDPVLQSNKIIFSGIVPGGFGGIIDHFSTEKKDGKIFSLVFYSKKEGSGTIKFGDNILVLKNDGQGTSVSVKDNEFNFLIKGNKSSSDFSYQNNDINPPELFNLKITNDSNIFDNKYFLVFNTQDKESGIYYYKVKEGNRNFKVAKSPYLLEDQNLSSDITVQAVDNAGNIREAYLEAQNKKFFSKRLLAWLVVLLFILIILFLNRKNKVYVKFKRKFF